MEELRKELLFYYKQFGIIVNDGNETEINKYMQEQQVWVEQIKQLDAAEVEKAELLKWMFQQNEAINKIAAAKKRQFETILKSEQGVSRAIKGYHW